MDGGDSFVSAQTPKRPRGRPPKVRAVVPEPDPEVARAPEADVAGREILEAIAREAADREARELEGFQARLRAAYRPVPLVIAELRALEARYVPELRRLAVLPWAEYRNRLGAETSVSALQGAVDKALRHFVGRAYSTYTVPPVVAQLEELGRSLARLRVADRPSADELLERCRRAPEWPGVITKKMIEVWDAQQRLLEALRRRGVAAAGSRPPEGGVSVTTPTGDPPRWAAPTAETSFDPLA
jgi:hypothetical protein